MPEKSTDLWTRWEKCPSPSAAAAHERLRTAFPALFDETTVVSARWTALPFYQHHRIIELGLRRAGTDARVFVLDGNDATWWLDGNSDAIYYVNDAEGLSLTAVSAADYLRFFCYFLRANDEPFRIIESEDELTATDFADETILRSAAAGGDAKAKPVWENLQAARAGVGPLRANTTERGARFLFSAAVVYGVHRWAAVFAVTSEGAVEMVDDQPVTELVGVQAPTYPKLRPEWEPPTAHVETPDDDDLDEQTGSAPANVDEQAFLAAWRGEVGAEPPVQTDKEVTEAVVGALLEDAVRRLDGGSVLLQHFNAETATDNPIKGLARLVQMTSPAIVIESDIPFVEEFVGSLIAHADPEVAARRQVRAVAVPGDDGKCQFDVGTGTATYFISLHAYRTIVDVERTAHELGIRDAAVLIGAARVSDVPQPLFQLIDAVLRLPRIDRRIFARVFERVMGVKPSPGWEGSGADWTRYLIPADFHAPRRRGWGPDEALVHLRDRVLRRLKNVSAESGPGLSELHGIGEAGRIAQDLIADIRSAQTGQIPWSSVDRGFLLVGRPGTGKTSLARAIAKESGIKFVNASATGWQSAGALDAHLRAMRSDFTDARRYAPSILFIDEIDSIGNRERLVGHNASYQTDVINALLEQIQGFETDSPVIVIGATNFADNVDPALKRAGRLDQAIQIPLPNIEGLEKIFEHYLAPYRAGNDVGPDVAPRLVAELTLGLTGADVEFFVRGAARRARRESRPIEQEDLLAEVTGRPRRADSAPQLGPEEMRRVAVHEGGHTTARLLGSRGGSELTFVTIVPRMDGSLGFVASLPREGSTLTRRQVIEEVETILSGRAAEEIVYGADDVGLGAGGSSPSSDLAIATSWATVLVCQSGLGGDKSLHWTRTPTSKQEEQIDEMLSLSYASALAKLRANRKLLDEVTELLVRNQEVDGGQLRALVGGR